MSQKIHAGFLGTGSYLPEKILTNQDLEKIVETSDEWITTRTGIKERHIARTDESTACLVQAKIGASRAAAFDLAAAC